MDSLEDIIEESPAENKQNQMKNTSFPNFVSQDYLLINSPKQPSKIISRETENEKILKPSKKALNIQIMPLRAKKENTFVEKTLNEANSNLGDAKEKFKTIRRNSRTPSVIQKFLLSPFLKNKNPAHYHENSNETHLNNNIKIFSAQLRNNNDLKSYYEEKAQERNTEFKRRDHFRKITKKLSKQYSKIMFPAGTLKFRQFSQVAIGVIRIKSFLRKRRAKKYVDLFGKLLEGKGEAGDHSLDEATTALINFDLESLHSKLIKRNIYSDPFFIQIIEKFSFSSILREFRSSEKTIFDFLIFIGRTISYYSKVLVMSGFYNIFTCLMIIINSFSLYQEFTVIEETLPKTMCLNLTVYPPPLDNSYHKINEISIFYFFMEMIIKIIAFGPIKYIRSFWNIADMVILYLNYHFMFIDYSTYFQPIPLRIFKFVNLLKIKALQTMVKSLGKSLILLAETFFIFLFIGSLFAICGVQIFSGLLKYRCYDTITGIYLSNMTCGNKGCPDGYACWKYLENLEFGALSFDNFGGAFILVLRVMTLSVWTPIMYSIQTTYSIYVWIYFISLIIFGNFFLLNMNLAVLKVKFSQNYGKMLESSEKAKKYNFKMLLQRKIIRSGKEVADTLNKGINLTRRQSQSLWKNYGQFMRVNSLSKTAGLRDKKLNFKKNYLRCDCRKILLIIIEGIKKILIENSKNVDLVKNNLEVVVNHEQEYHSLSVNDIFHDREMSKLQSELQKNQIALKKQKLIREYSISSLIPTVEKKNSNPVKIFNKTEISMNNSVVSKKKSLQITNWASSKNISLQKQKSISKNTTQMTDGKRSFCQVRKHSSPNLKKSNIINNTNANNDFNMDFSQRPKASLELRIEKDKSSSPMKSPRKTIKDLKIAIEKKFYRKNHPEIPIEYYSLKKAINEEFVENVDEEIPNYFWLYVKILENDIKSKKISKYHWSGVNVLPSKLNEKNYWISIFLDLSHHNIEIWVTGLRGFMKILKKISNKILNSHIFAQMSIVFTILTLVILSFEGDISKSDYDLMFSLLTHFFVVDFILKIIVMGFTVYLAKPLNRVEFIILLYSVALIYFGQEIGTIENGSFKSLRLLRVIIVFRALRLLSYLEYMKFILLVLSTTFDYFIYIAFFLILMILVFSLISKQIYSQGCDFSNLLSQEKSFSSFASTVITIFNFITLDNWNTLITATSKFNMEKPMIAIALLLIFLGNFIVLNLFIAIMLDSFEVVKQKIEQEKEKSEKKEVIQKTNKQLYLELKNKENAAHAMQSNNALPNKSMDISKQMLESSESEIFSEKSLEEQAISSPLTPHYIKKFLSKNSSDIVYFAGVSCMFSLFLFSQNNCFRKWCYRTINNPFFEILIYFLIIVVCFVLALNTFFEETSVILFTINILVNIGFFFESFIKIISLGLILDKGSFLRDYKNALDLATIGISFLGIIVSQNEALKGIMLIRLWRPLSIIYKRKYIRDLINALISSLYQIINVFIVVFLVWYVFSLIGIQFYHDRFGYCEYRTNFYISKEECESSNLIWKIYYLNFDNIKSALVTIFVFSTMDNWAGLLHVAVNSDLAERGPSRYNNQFSSYIFFIAFIVIAIWLFFNLFIGVIFTNFMEISRKNIHHFLTPEQVKWLEVQNYIIKVDSRIFKVPEKGWRLFFYNFFRGKKYSYFSNFCLALNFCILVMSGETAENSIWFHKFLYTICILQILDIIFKFYVYRMDYFRVNPWNWFNLFATIVYIPDMFSGYLLPYFGERIIRLLSGLKVFSLIRIIEKIDVLKALILNLFLSWRLILNMILLLFIIIFIYAVIGVFMFKNVIQGECINDYNNFKNLFYALMTLFKCVTREEWTNLLFDLSKTPPDCIENVNCGSAFTPIYLISFMILNTYIIFNLFILILLQQFEEFHKNTFNPMVAFKQYLPYFKEVWNRCCVFENGRGNTNGRIHIHKIIRFYKELGPPLGYKIIILAFLF